MSCGSKKADPGKRGKWGEDIVLDHMINKGYTLVTSGFRSRFGNIFFHKYIQHIDKVL